MKLSETQKGILIGVGAILLILTIILLSTRGTEDNPSNNNSNQNQATESGERNNVIKTFTVGPEKEDCEGVGPQECLVVDGELFYDEIEGFEFEEGKTQKVRVRQIQQYDNEDDIPADGSLYRYQMIGVVSVEE